MNIVKSENSNYDYDRFEPDDVDIFTVVDADIVNPSILSITVRFSGVAAWL